ncbi:MAG: helix-turn-helix domain-containing protein [Rhodothalassiaceae bacterium]
MSQEQLGDALGLTFQQVQKYERGANRMGSSRLYKIAQILNVPVSYFFDEIPEDADPQPFVQSDMEDVDPKLMIKRETLELTRAFHKISTADTRRALIDIINKLADNDPSKQAA